MINALLVFLLTPVISLILIGYHRGESVGSQAFSSARRFCTLGILFFAATLVLGGQGELILGPSSDSLMLLTHVLSWICTVLAICGVFEILAKPKEPAAPTSPPRQSEPPRQIQRP